MKPAAIQRLFQKLHDSNPHPESELDHRNHFELLIAVMLSAQATDKSVNRVSPHLFEAYPTPEAMLEAGEEGVLEKIRTIGLANTKAKNVIKTCRLLIDKHQSEIPENREALEALPGVGRKTANVVLNVAFGHPTIAVDTHVFRVSNRTGLTEAKNVLQTEEQLLRIIPKKWKTDAHHYLILHGRYICVARKPKCAQCPIHQECLYPEKL